MNFFPNLNKFLPLLFTGLFSTGIVSAQTTWTSFIQFTDSLEAINAISNATERTNAFNALWQSLKNDKRIPFAMGNEVAFLYPTSTGTVSVAGDFNGWNPSASGWQMQKYSNLNLYRLIKSFPPDARLDYKIVVGSNWILDPSNPYTQMSGFGNNSELRMPSWSQSPYLTRQAGIKKGNFSANIPFTSIKLGYKVQYRVYTPAGYDSLTNLPVIYITDGHEYSNDAMGSMIIILDNLIAAQLIQPVIAVFMDPRNPDNTNSNRRGSEYVMNSSFLSYVCDELVPKIDSDYKTDAKPESRAILGTSLGGLNSAYFGGSRPDVFRLIAIQSPAFWTAQQVYNLYKGDLLPLKIFMSTGVIGDTEDEARVFESTYLKPKGYDYHYIEVSEGHSWGNWRALNDDVLLFFFKKETGVKVNDTGKPERHGLIRNYPNPFNPSTTFEVNHHSYTPLIVQIFDQIGRQIQTLKPGISTPGIHRFSASFAGLPSGKYFYRLVSDPLQPTGYFILLK